jgi:hypothetical protein
LRIIKTLKIKVLKIKKKKRSPLPPWPRVADNPIGKNEGG